MTEKAYISNETGKLFRGPLNENDKHWGMRGNKKFRKELKK